MRVALHACCGPCLLEPFDALAVEADEVTIVYANPNIHPLSEYELRRDTLVAYADSVGATVVELGYAPEEWLATAGRYGRDRERRCRACYRLRLTMVARWAAENGFDSVATTLTVSPYQDAGALEEEARRACDEVKVSYVGSDYRDRYVEATRRSRELGMYRQNYCGCLMSDVEAQAERQQRRRQRASKRREGAE